MSMNVWEWRRPNGAVLYRLLGDPTFVHIDPPITGHVQVFRNDRLMIETWGWPRYDWVKVDGEWMHRDPAIRKEAP